MKISLSEVAASRGQKLDFDYELDLSAEEVGFEKPFQSPVRLHGSLDTSTGVNRLDAVIEARVTQACARCLTPVTRDKRLEVSLMLVRQVDNDELDDMVLVESDEVDLDELLVPELILDMDMVVLCREDCKGLCPKCGKNLNEGDCGCDRREIDPRLQKLHDLLNR